MKVFKFGGASVKSAAGVRNVASIIARYPQKGLLIVVSAMGKTTNSLENLLFAVRTGKNASLLLDELYEYHLSVMRTLFSSTHVAYSAVDEIMGDLRAALLQSYTDPDMMYDQVVAKGELISSTIVHHHLTDMGLPSAWLDARSCITTDSTFREGKVDWRKTAAAIEKIKPALANGIVITQGFIGQTEDGLTTTLGREGSDFTAAIFASCLEAVSVTIWKDVPGVMSADPKRLPNATVFSELPFREAAEMTYYGASVIHPKTIKPLANKGIPLWVKNFDDPSLPGTIIHDCTVENLPPLIVFKENQCLVSCKVTDFTFITEEQLGFVFRALTELGLRINVMQNSAISFSFCVDFREGKVTALIQKLQEHFEVFYNTSLTLITIKNYDEQSFEKYRKHDGVLLEQSSRSTLQVLVRL